MARPHGLPDEQTRQCLRPGHNLIIEEALKDDERPLLRRLLRPPHRYGRRLAHGAAHRHAQG